MEAMQDTGSSEKVEGTNVYNRAGETLGTIHALMIDKSSGHVAYAIMSFGGFLGMGNQFHPLPSFLATKSTTSISISPTT